MQNGDSEIVAELPKSSAVLFKVVIFQDVYKVEESYGESYLQGLPNNRLGNQYFDRRISYNTFPTRCPNDKKKRQNKTYFKWEKNLFLWKTSRRWLNTNNLSRV